VERPAVLVIEDEEPIRVGLCDVLAFHGLAPTAAADGTTGLRLGREGTWALVVVDVMLPGVDGFTITRALREAHPSLPILVLTAKGAEADVLEGFAAGADDYVTKPFSVAQLAARVRALVRRSAGAGRRRFGLGPATVDVDALTLSTARGTVPLSPRDAELLGYLADRAGTVVPREALLRDVWRFQRTERVETRCVDMHLSKLRRKLLSVCDDELIETVRGAGYRVRP
jgi:DNA-binding response OmpR family regulator